MKMQDRFHLAQESARRSFLILMGTAIGIALSAASFAARVTAVSGDLITLDTGSLNGVYEGAKVGIGPGGGVLMESWTEASAPGMAVVEQSSAMSATARIARQPAGQAVAVGWIARILSQEPTQRSLSIKVVVDDSNLRIETSGDGFRGCAGIRKSLRLEAAQNATQEIQKELPKQPDTQVKVETPAAPTPTPTLPPPPSTEAPAQKTSAPPAATPLPPTPSPSPAPAPAAEPADLNLKISFLPGKGADELIAEIIVFGAGGDVLEKVSVPAAQAPQKAKELIEKYRQAEQSRQSLLNLHNPQPGFEIELWLNVPGGPATASTSHLAEAIESTVASRPIRIGVGAAEKEKKVEPGRPISMKRGTQHTYGFRSKKDCYLVLYNIAQNGEITQLFPNPYIKDNFIKANQTYTIPDPAFRTEKGEPVYFVVDEQKEVGLEIVKALATREKMALTEANLGEIEKQGFPAATPAPPGAQWGAAANSLANKMALTRSLNNVNMRKISYTTGQRQAAINAPAQPSPEPTVPPDMQTTLKEISDYLRELNRWSDAMITFYTTD